MTNGSRKAIIFINFDTSGSVRIIAGALASMSLRKHHPRRAIVFDGDDTLWATQELYDGAKAEFFALLESLGWDQTAAAEYFAKIDLANLAQLGLSRTRFPKSMRDTYEFLCNRTLVPVEPDIASRAENIGKGVFAATPTVAADAAAVLKQLKPLYRLVLFTSGDESVQKERIDQSSLEEYFDAVCIAPRKTGASWRQLLREQDLSSATTWSVGNSVRSDINPSLELGMRCVALATRTWDYERTALVTPPPGAHVWHATTLTESAEIVLRADGIVPVAEPV
jgi:putative hydrolase of the HAD superfamily